VKEKLLQSWRYKTLAVIKRHKTHLFLSFVKAMLFGHEFCDCLLGEKLYTSQQTKAQFTDEQWRS